MTLAEFVSQKTTYRALAAKIAEVAGRSISGAQLQRIATAERGFSPGIANAIVKATDGAVTLDDLMKPYRGKAA